MLVHVSDDGTFGRFLRARREQLRPADVGLPDRGRRRTPGLRREEVATLAGVSIDYLVRLEQGRDSNPSADVLASLAAALRLTDEERMHMVKLAHLENGQSLCPESRPAEHDVPVTVLTLLDRLQPTPAIVVGPFSDVLAWNPAWERVVAGIGLLDRGPADEPANLARFVLTDPRASDAFPDWDAMADEQVARLRAAHTWWSDDTRLTSLIDELSPVPAFAERWSRHTVADLRRGTHRLQHPSAGELRLACEVLAVAGTDGQHLVTWLPADDATATRLDALVADEVATSPPRLRLVAES